MNVLFVSPTVDTAGLGIASKRAFDAYGGAWHARHVRRSNSWLDYPRDIQWDMEDWQQTAFIQQLWRQADVVVLIEQPAAAQWGPRKPFVVWHLGTFYRRQVEEVTRQCRMIDALEVADMADLICRAPKPIGWMPDLIDPEPLRRLRSATPRNGRVRIAHAPTDRSIKRTDVVLAAIERLGRMREFDFDLIEKVPNAECLARKAAADIFIDDMGGLGIGLNALECFAMGIPVVSAIADPKVATRMRADYGGALPFLVADEDILTAVLTELVDSPEQRREWAHDAEAALERYHTPQAAVRQWTALFAGMLEAVA